MEVLRYIVMGIYAIVCVVLVALILKQTKEDGGASGTIVGASANNFYEKNKGRTKEGRIKRITIMLGVLFVIFAILLGILYVI